MIQIPLTKGQFALIDDCDSDLAKLKWYVGGGYACRAGQLMHRIILGRMLGRSLSRFEWVDHINGDRADNQRCNLRLTNGSLNQANRTIPKNNKTKYKGVSLDMAAARKNCKKAYRAAIQVNGKSIKLGLYALPEEAALAYNGAALKYFGEFARLNEIAN